MNNLRPKNNQLLDSLDKLELVYLIEEVRLNIFFLEEQSKIKKYFFEKVLEEKPSKIYKRKYDAWRIKFKDLKDDYEKTLNNYIEECNYFEKLMDLLKKNKNNE